MCGSIINDVPRVCPKRPRAHKKGLEGSVTQHCTRSTGICFARWECEQFNAVLVLVLEIFKKIG